MNENLKALTNQSSASSSLILHDYVEKYPPYHTSIDVKATGLYNIYQGVVCFIGNESSGLYYVCVKLSGAYVFKYGHLESVSTRMDTRIKPGEVIGVCRGYGTFEFLSPKESKFPFYIEDKKYYKNDPTDIIVNDILPSIKISTYTHTSDEPVLLPIT